MDTEASYSPSIQLSNMSFPTAAFPTAAAEQSSLTYTLLNEAELSWSEFDLIIRSLHSYKVIKFEPNEESKTITVTVAYFANAGNARRKLGRLDGLIGVSRESSNVQLSELQTLQRLRAKYGFGKVDDDEECETPKPRKKARYANCN